ncbi:MAG: GNAT family N-acetyltransferase [Dermabacter sp.]|nr:GNAT family N-acetyltransferase [Dermabacter sp.]
MNDAVTRDPIVPEPSEERDCGGAHDPCLDYEDDVPEAEATVADGEASMPGPAPESVEDKANALETIFAPFALKITLGDLELRLIRDADFPAYAALLREDIFAPEFAEAMFPWLDAEPEDRIRGALQYQWGKRASLDPSSWELPLGVFYRGALIGSQSIVATSFELSRTVETGSWLTRAYQGRGLGTLARQAVVDFSFTHLKADRAESSALVTNTPSLRVSRRLGYVDNGTQMVVEGGKACLHQRVLVTPQTFVRPDTPVQVEGLTPDLITLLGVG